MTGKSMSSALSEPVRGPESCLYGHNEAGYEATTRERENNDKSSKKAIFQRCEASKECPRRLAKTMTR